MFVWAYATPTEMRLYAYTYPVLWPMQNVYGVTRQGWVLHLAEAVWVRAVLLCGIAFARHRRRERCTLPWPFGSELCSAWLGRHTDRQVHI